MICHLNIILVENNIKYAVFVALSCEIDIRYDWTNSVDFPNHGRTQTLIEHPKNYFDCDQ